MTDTLPRMRLDVFTQVPHAFGWLTEQKPLATVLGTELDLRLFEPDDAAAWTPEVLESSQASWAATGAAGRAVYVKKTRPRRNG